MARPPLGAWSEAGVELAGAEKKGGGLIDELWGTEPPESAVNVIQTLTYTKTRNGNRRILKRSLR